MRFYYTGLLMFFILGIVGFYLSYPVGGVLAVIIGVWFHRWFTAKLDAKIEQALAIELRMQSQTVEGQQARPIEHQTPPVQPVIPTPPVQPTAGAAVKQFCPNCGAKVLPGHVFCVQCGTKIN